MVKHRANLLIHLSVFMLWSGSMVYAFEKDSLGRASGNEGDRKRIYVSAGASDQGDGQSWPTAFNSLQQALDHAVPDTEIWVAKGIYLPESKVGGRSTRNKSFQLKSHVMLLGGFEGTESKREERDWRVHKTILSGDLKRNDAHGESMGDNCYHVITGNGTDSTAVLDGFWISGGNADRKKWPDDGGGGMNNHEGSPTVIHCVFEKNHCYADGGGMRNWGDCSPRVIRTVFKENRSEQEGAGMMNGPDSRTLVLHCTFTNNYSDEDGGGIYNNETKHHFIVNCLFHHNTAALTGGGIYHVNNSQTQVVNCTFTKNNAAKAGGGVSNRDSNPVMVNCILWENEAPENSEINNLRSEPSVSYSNITGGYDGTSNMNEHPMFVPGKFELSAGSPCIDKGKSEAIPDFILLDLNSQPRIVGEAIDMGAYEFINK